MMGNIEVRKLDIYSAELRSDLIFNLDIMISRGLVILLTKKISMPTLPKMK